MSDETINPFPGLRPFRTDEEYLFFGREAQCQDLIRLLQGRRFIGVLGSSGTGKSSLVRAGLMPALYRGALVKAGSHWDVAICRPGGNPMSNLALALAESEIWDNLNEDEPVPDRLEIETILQRSAMGLREVAHMARLPKTENLLVVVDQFEELFRFHQRTSLAEDRDVAEAFVNLLLEGARDENFSIHVVLTMRSDFFGDCAAFSGLSEVINQGAYLVPRLTRAQLKDAIEGPARVGGGSMAPRLVQRLLNDVGGDPDELPVLQHALMRTWNRWRERDIPHEELDLYHYEEIGGMEEALSRHADEIYESLSEPDRLVTKRLFKALTEQGAQNRGVRRPISLERLLGVTRADEVTLRRVIDAYRAPGVTFLMPSAEASLALSSVVDISHESLMRVWKRLRRWVEKEAQSARIYRRLSETAALWEDGKAQLYHDPDLHVAHTWNAVNQPNALWAERYGGGFERAMRFLDKSQVEKEKEEREREESRRRELAQAKELADVRSRSARRSWALSIALCFLTLMLAAAATAAYFAMRYARSQASVAQQARGKAEAAQQSISASFSQSDYQFGQAAAEERRYGESLAYLTRALELEPDFTAAADRIYTLLTEVSLPVPHFHHDDSHDLEVMAFSSDSTKIITGSSDDYVRVWDIASSEELRRWKHERTIVALAVSGDGDWVASGGRGGIIAVVSLRTGDDSVKQFRHDQDVQSLAFSGDERWLASGSADDSVGVWDLANESLLKRFQHTSSVNEVRFSPDDRKLVSAGDDNVARVWDLQTGRQLFVLEHDDDVKTARFDPSGERIVTASQDRTVKVWNAFTGELLMTMFHDDEVREAMFSPDGKTIASGSDDNTVRLWGAITGDELQHWTHQDAVDDIDFSPDGLMIASASDDMTVRLWETQTGREAAVSPLKHRKDVDGATFSPDGSWLGTLANNEARVWRFEDFRELPLEFEAPGVTAAILSPDSEWVMAGTEDGQVMQWNRRTAGSRGPTFEMPAPITHVAYSQDGALLMAGDQDGHVSLRSASTGASVAELMHPEPITWFDLHPDGQTLVVVHGNSLQYWNVPSGERGDLVDLQESLIKAVYSPKGDQLAVSTMLGVVFLAQSDPWQLQHTLTHGSAVNDVTFSPNTALLATASADWSTQLWQTADGERLHGSLDHSGEVVVVNFSPNGGMMVTGARDQRAIVWSVQEGTVNGRSMTHNGSVLWADFSPDSRRVVTACSDRTARVWDIETSLPLTQPLMHGAAVTYAAFTPDGRQILTMAPGDGLKLWSVSLGAEAAEVPKIFLEVAQAIGGLRLDSSNRLVPLDPGRRRQILGRAGALLQRSGATISNPYERFISEFMAEHGPQLGRKRRDGRPPRWRSRPTPPSAERPLGERLQAPEVDNPPSQR